MQGGTSNFYIWPSHTYMWAHSPIHTREGGGMKWYSHSFLMLFRLLTTSFLLGHPYSHSWVYLKSWEKSYFYSTYSKFLIPRLSSNILFILLSQT